MELRRIFLTHLVAGAKARAKQRALETPISSDGCSSEVCCSYRFAEDECVVVVHLTKVRRAYGKLYAVYSNTTRPFNGGM